MKNTIDLQNGCCGRAADARSANRVIVLAVVSTLLATSTYASGNPPVQPGGTHVGLNTGVALEKADSSPEPPPSEEIASAASEHVSAQEGPHRDRPLEQSGFKRKVLGRRFRADEQTNQAQSTATPWYRTGIGALSIVLAVVAAIYYILRRCVPSIRTADNEKVRVLGRTSLTPKHHLALVQCGQRILAIGVSGDRMTTLCEVRDPEEVAELTAGTSKQREEKRGGFDDLLLHEAGEYSDPPGEAVVASLSTSAGGAAGERPVRNLLQRLRTLTTK